MRLAVAVLLAAAAPAAAQTRPPNVVLIVADDLGQRDLGCYGSTFHRTPHLDALAKAGARFTDCTSSCPVCSPTRASILTGMYPQRFGVTDWLPGRPDQPGQMLRRPVPTMQLAHDAVTLAERLRAAGYATAHVGKWHLGGEGFGPESQGFDLNVAGDHTGTPLSYFAPFQNKKSVMRGLENAPAGEYLTDRLTAEAEKFITRNKERPFFLHLAHYAPHTPLRAPDDVVARYPAPPVHGRQSNAVYAAMVERLDAGVGRVVALLDELKLTDNTIVIFTSDNGGLATLEGMPFAPTYNGPFREGKGYLYEGGLRVPLLVKWPGRVTPGNTPTFAANSIDLTPTIVAACGVTPDPRADGTSLLPLFRGQAPAARDLFWHYPHYANQGSRPGGAVRSGPWKFVEFYETNRRELFDLSRDQSESNNLAAARPEVVAELAAKLEAWRKGVGAKMPTPNPDYRPNPANGNGVFTLHARTAQVYGTMLRYEPLPHKETLGFWVRQDDHAAFPFTAGAAGEYRVEVLQGCGKGSGGAEVELAVGDSKLTFTVKDTGGFQAFEARDVGVLRLPGSGRHELTVRARTKPGVAVMDLRQVVLRPVR
ncbi:MAG: sulfatase-like hydrolase/transferase [Gemmataceae bacterium]